MKGQEGEGGRKRAGEQIDGLQRAFGRWKCKMSLFTVKVKLEISVYNAVIMMSLVDCALKNIKNQFFLHF